MRSLATLAACTAAAALTQSATAAAAVVIDRFSGALTAVGGSLALGEGFDGTLTYDSSQLGTPNLGTARDYTYTSLSLTVGSEHYSFANGWFEVDDNGSFVGDRVDVEFPGGTIGGLPYSFGRLRLVDFDNDAISNNHLPFNANPSDWVFKEVRFFAQGVDVIGEIRTLTSAPVPEPATWAMLLVGLGGLGAALRSRRARAV
jgi:hypothetical protein